MTSTQLFGRCSCRWSDEFRRSVGVAYMINSKIRVKISMINNKRHEESAGSNEMLPRRRKSPEHWNRKLVRWPLIRRKSTVYSVGDSGSPARQPPTVPLYTHLGVSMFGPRRVISWKGIRDVILDHGCCILDGECDYEAAVTLCRQACAEAGPNSDRLPNGYKRIDANGSSLRFGRGWENFVFLAKRMN
ncbi:hypothetical protein BKA66DRAFT_445995 [Pyrenochaeta sp. MPI-SDFR-AT-0127]|nr:hypothetical protein BKA66DRAFT_445995 [Pyrenochaeta sp. MPI-SDFR-AT-0127]